MPSKKYIKSRKVSKITFEVAQSELPTDLQIESVYLVGDFNDWDQTATPMKRLKKGSYKTSLNLDPGQEYRFRYLVNGEQWCNDWHADAYIPNDFGIDNCVVVTPSQ
jgi:1,4-alpha-glucan branching enzyme